MATVNNNSKKNIIYDSLESRIRSGRTNKSREELRKSFKTILEKLKENNMLSPKGREISNLGRIKKDFKLTSNMVNQTGKRFLDRLYRIHMRPKQASIQEQSKKIWEERIQQKGRPMEYKGEIIKPKLKQSSVTNKYKNLVKMGMEKIAEVINS